MFGTSGNTRRLLGLGAMGLLLLGRPVIAEDVSEAQILKALSAPAPQRTRSLSVGAQAPATPPADAAFVDSLRNKPTRSLSMGERQKLDVVAAEKPQIDLAMEFDVNSDALRGEALVTANKLGKALSNSAMQGQTFVIAGHTDAKGSDSANQSLSERRAESVRRFLVNTYQIPESNLISVGYGKAHLKNQADPLARENRRVQAVNLLQVKTAGR
ncbi:OmpA family protein [uncultured Methylobacterium sp.]|uniref:OmpA family protein n=1 Tax=uncultured Methylobacterium sp. TaxID=157278 RepID=UPI0035CB7A71